MPQKLYFYIYLLDTTFQITIPHFLNDTQLPLSSILNTFGLSFTENLNWQFHISTLAKSASKRLVVPWRLSSFFSSSQHLALYRGLIRPCMEYGSHVWRCSTHTALLNEVESKAFCLINSPSLTPLTDCLDSLSHRCNVAFLSLFYWYFHTGCSFKLANCMPSPLPRLRCTRLSTSSYLYSVHLPNARVN